MGDKAVLKIYRGRIASPEGEAAPSGIAYGAIAGGRHDGHEVEIHTGRCHCGAYYIRIRCVCGETYDEVRPVEARGGMAPAGFLWLDKSGNEVQPG